jgi:ferrous iron transport protein A
MAIEKDNTQDLAKDLITNFSDNKKKMEHIDLTQLEEGKSGVVVHIHGGQGLVRRLESLGIRVGKKLTKVSSQFMRGPVCVRIDSYQVALGFGMAKKIFLEEK